MHLKAVLVAFAIGATPAFGEVLDSVPATAQQEKFNNAVAEYSAAYASAANAMAAGAQQQKRAKALCSILGKSRAAKDWTGFITELSSNGDGLGVLAIETGKGVTIKTWNNALSDSGDNTLLPLDSPVMEVAMNLSVGQAVQFSGTFVRDRAQCIRESSITQDGSMRQPEFIMRFTNLKQLGDKYQSKAKSGESLLHKLFGSD